MDYRYFSIKPISGALGAEVFGIDLSGDIEAATMREIVDAWHEYIVLLFRDQQLSVAQQQAFAQRFGELIPHPYVTGLDECPEIFRIIREPGENFSWDNYYHSDLMFLQRPPLGSALYAEEVPPYGADTEFCNLYLAYETLSPGMQTLLKTLRAVHDSGDPAHYHTKYQSMHERENRAQRCAHPVVRVHPDTGREALFISLAFTTHFEGMTVEESAPLLNYLYRHATQSHFGCRLHWQPGSLALWDNRVSLHHAVADYFGEVTRHRRVLRRATIAGEAPIAAIPDVSCQQPAASVQV